MNKFFYLLFFGSFLFPTNVLAAEFAEDEPIHSQFWDRENNDTINAMICDSDKKCEIFVRLDPNISVPGDLTFGDILNELSHSLSTVNRASSNISYNYDVDGSFNNIIKSDIIAVNERARYDIEQFYNDDGVRISQITISLNTISQQNPNTGILYEFGTIETCGLNNSVDVYFDIEKSLNHELYHTFGVPHNFDRFSIVARDGYFCGNEFGYMLTSDDVGYLQEKYPNIESISLSIPEWIKNNAGWWADNVVGDNTFVDAIEWLILEGIINISEEESGAPSDEIPNWIKNVAGWWAEGTTSDQEFADALEHLIKIGVIQL